MPATANLCMTPHIGHPGFPDGVFPAPKRHGVCIFARWAFLVSGGRMPYMDQRKVNQAIRDCVRRCDRTHHILARIEEFLLSLKASRGWREAELRAVETGVRRVLYGILDGATYAGDAKNQPASESAPDSYWPKVSGA
jgi:hypothetical protein